MSWKQKTFVSAALLALVGGTTLSLGVGRLDDDAPDVGAAVAAAAAARAGGAPGKSDEKPDFPPFAEVTKGFTKVVSTADGAPSLYTLYRRDKDQRLLAELPRDYERQKIFIATTIAGGAPMTGIQLGDLYAYWKRYDKRLALLEPNVAVRSQGDAESKKTEEKVYTDRVILDVPIVAMGPGGGPVIDLGALLVGKADEFFGFMAAGANRSLATIDKAKAFPKNIEVAFEMPAMGGRLTTFHYSLSEIPARGSYQPREADPRVGYFITSFRDIARQDKDTQWVRYINRWNLEKRDPKLKLSPPKEPIVFYIEATTPVHYRRWVREGILAWNKAFEKVGFIDAVEVYQQDAQTGAHMDKDPEDVRYNFVRWTSANLGFAIGPSRVHPETGQILDADVVVDDGFLRGWYRSYKELLPEVAMTGYGPDVLAWLDRNPQWDPRLRLAEPGERQTMLRARQMAGARAAHRQLRAADAADAAGDEAPPMMRLRSGDQLLFSSFGAGPDGQVRFNAMRCSNMLGRSIDMAMARMDIDLILALSGDDDEPKGGEPGESGDQGDKAEKTDKKPGEPKEEKEALLDGMPESFVGPLLADLIAHEVGHTLGLRHNFKASSIHELSAMNTPEFKGNKTLTGSVMDYNPININFKDGPVQGDYSMIGVGPYDFWAIEYGYTTARDLKPVLAKVANDELPYATDEDVFGPDPLAKQFDLGKDSLDYADSTLRLVGHLRGKIIDRIVKEGDGWQRARDAYSLLLARQMGSVRVASYYLGGADIRRDRKGDPGNRPPVTPVDAATQRRALQIIIDNTFRDEAFGLSRELLARLTVDKWYDEGGARTYFEDPAWPVHDRILGVQASAMTMLLNPTTLQRIYDNEFRVDPGTDAFTLPELLAGVEKGVWTELDQGLSSGTARQPAISSLRRNLQREHLNRLLDLVSSDEAFTAAYKPISNLIVLRVRELKERLDKALKSDLDPYTKAHLQEAALRIEKTLDAQVIYNADQIGGGGGIIFFFGEPGAQPGDGPATPGLPAGAPGAEPERP